MGDFRSRLLAFMQGRNGLDAFGRFLFIFSFACSILATVFRLLLLRRIWLVLYLLNLAGYLYAIFRVLSRDLYRRDVENQWYLRMRERVWPRLSSFFGRRFNRDYVFKNCPFCHSELRLRRIRGRHTTRCPRCGKQFRLRVYWGPMVQ